MYDKKFALDARELCLELEDVLKKKGKTPREVVYSLTILLAISAKVSGLSKQELLVFLSECWEDYIESARSR